MAPILNTLAVFAGISAARQTVPTIAGTWVIVPEASVYHDRVGNPINIRIFGDSFVAQQDERTLAIAIDNEKGFVWRYNLDGTESHHTLPLPSGDALTVSKLAVEGSKFVITTASNSGRATVRTIELRADGTLRVEAPFGEGGEMIGSVYRRVRDQVAGGGMKE